eukprot:9320109-Karenia_brevis.AAC.1
MAEFPLFSVLCFADTNARPPPPDYCHVGDWGTHRVPPTTSSLASFLRQNTLYLPSALPYLVSPECGEGSYFWDPDQPPVLIDYIITAQQVE